MALTVVFTADVTFVVPLVWGVAVVWDFAVVIDIEVVIGYAWVVGSGKVPFERQTVSLVERSAEDFISLVDKKKNPEQGGHLCKVWVEVCHWGLQSLTQFETKTIRFTFHDPYSLRSKRFRLVSEQRKTEERDSQFWPRKKWTIFHAVFDSRSSFFAPKPHGNTCYAGYDPYCITILYIYITMIGFNF